MIPIVQAFDAAGRRHELQAIPVSEFDARRLAVRAAAILGRIGTPDVWRGGRLVVVDAADGRLVAVARIRVTARTAAGDG